MIKIETIMKANFNIAKNIRNSRSIGLIVLALILGSLHVWGATYTYDFTTANNFYTTQGGSTHPATGSSNKFSNGDSFYAADGAQFTVLYDNKVYFSTGYILIGNQSPVFQLPTYSGEKITQVKFWNSSGCSTSVKVTIKAGSSTASAEQTWSTQNSTYTYPIGASYQASTLKLNIVSANAQITKIEITTSSECAKSVTVSDGSSSTHGSITSITTSPVATCSSTATDRQVSIVVTPANGYTAPEDLSVGSTSGTVTSTKISRTDNLNGTFTFVYRYNQNDNGSISYNAACAAKTYTISLNDQDATTAASPSSITATFDSNTGLTGTVVTTLPTKTGYTFGGYYNAAGGSGVQLINSSGEIVASASGGGKTYTDASKNWIHSGGVTVYAKWTEKALTNYRTLCCTELPAPTNPNETPSNEGGTLYWDEVTGATGYEVNIDGGGWISTGNGTTCNYTVTGKACGGTSVSWQVRATGDGTTNCAAGAPTTVRNFSTSSCSCTGTYSFHYQHSGAWNAENICFSPVAGATNNYLTDELSLPYAENYKVAWQGVDQSYTSSTGFNGNMPFFHNRDKKFGANPQSGNLGGGKGKFHVYHDSGSTNKYVSFIPTGYTLNFGTGDTWTNDSTKTFTGKTNAWDETEWYTDLITLKDGTIGKKIFVGLQTASGYVWCDPYSQKDNLSGLRTKSGSGESWVTGGLTTSYPNKTGKFRIYANSGDKNWYVTFVPHFQLKYNANGGTGTMSPLPATPVSCEETSGNRTVTVATSSFTAPTGKVFDHWNTAADNSGSNVSTGSYTLTGDVTLYAIWRDADYTVTLNQSPSVGATLTGATNTAHYGGTINISASEPTGYQFVNWTSSPSVTFADATSASTSFTMPASNVTITANYVQVYTVTFVHHDKGAFSGGSTEVLVPTSSNTITLPTVTDVSCGFYDTFEGWIASGSEYSESTSKPATVYAGGSSYTVSSDVTLRALYSKCEGAGGQSYHKVTAIGDVTDGTYILVSNASTPTVYSGHSGSNTYGDCVTGLTADGDDYSSTLPSGAVQVTVTRGTGGNASKFTIHNGSKYIVAGTESTGTSDSESWWQLTTGSNVNSKACPAGVIQPASYTDNVLQENNTYHRFRTYKNSQTAYVFLYKLIDKCTKSYATNPSCIKPTGVHITYNANALDATMSCSTSNRTYKVVDAVNQYPKLASAYTFCDNATRDGYTLVGWNTQANGLGTTYELDHSYSNLPVSGDLDGDNYVTLTVYAMWAPSVSFNVGNATGGTGVPDVIEADGGFMLPTPTAAQIGTIPCGYSFYGWSESSVVATSTKPTLYMPGTKYTGSYRTLYAVYRLAGEGGNPDLFSLSYTYSATKYYVAKPTDIATAPSTWGSDKVKKFSATTDPEEALAFGTKSIGGKTVKSFYWMYDDEEVYVYWKDNAGSLTHANEEDTDYGWTISGTTDLTFSTTYPGQTARQIVFTAPSYGDPATFNASTSAATSLHKEEASTTTYTYATNPSCETTATLQFVTNGGTLNYPDTYDASNYVDLTVGTNVYLPTATYPGEWVFEGWMKGEDVSSTDIRPESANFIEVTLNTTTYSAAPAGTTTFHAVYSKTVNDKQFDPINGGTYKLFAIMADGTTKNYMPVWGGSRGTVASVTSCASTGDYTITPGTGVHAGQYKITCGSYTLGVVDDANTDLKDVADTWWNIESSTSGKGTYRITVVGSTYRGLSYGSSAFGNYALSQVNSSGQTMYRDMEIGECIYTEYTSTPENIPYITITGSPVKITSTNGERVYASSKIHVEAHNFTGVRTIHLNATNGFATNPAFVNTAANGAYSGDIDIYYQPTTAGDGSIVTSVLTASQIAGTTPEQISQTFSAIKGRNMPAKFVIAAKIGGQWYAMPDDKSTTETMTALPIEVNDADAPISATLVPHNVEWSLSDVVNSNDRPKDKVYLYESNKMKDDGITPWNYALYAGTAPTIGTYGQVSGISGTSSDRYEWGLTTSDLLEYTISNATVGKNISISNASNFGTHASAIASSTLFLLPIENYYELAEMQAVEWKANSVVVMFRGAGSKATAKLGAGAEGSAQSLTSVKKDHGVYEIATGDLTSAAGQSLAITIKNSSDVVLGRKLLVVPAIVSVDKNSDALGITTDAAAATDVVVLDGATLSAATTKYTFKNITVYPGGKLVIGSGKQLGMASLTLRGGSAWGAATYEHKYPQFVVNNTASDAYSNSAAVINYDYVTTKDQYYSFVLPYNGSTSAIKYPVDIYGSAVSASNTGSFEFQYYDGAARATGATGWKVLAEPATLEAGTGYTFFGMPKKVDAYDGSDSEHANTRQRYGIHRIPMSVAAATVQAGETGGGEPANKPISINVILASKNNDSGWNLVGNPYMANVSGLSNTDIQVGELVHTSTVPWDGKWQWDNPTSGVRYIVTTDDGQTFESQQASTATLKAFKNFFVQIQNAEANTLVIPATTRTDKSLAPARYMDEVEQDIQLAVDLISEARKDKVDLLINDIYTAEFDQDGDFTKMMNSTNFNLYGVYPGDNLSFIAVDKTTAANSIAVGYQVPAGGDYSLQLSDREYVMVDAIEALYVTDHEVSPEVTTNLLDGPYNFHVNNAETNDTRFTISIRLAPKTPTDIDIVPSEGQEEMQPMKFIYHDKMYILRGGVIYDATGKKVREIK